MATAVSRQYNWFVQNTLRAFIAIYLPQDVKNYLGQLSDDLAEQVPHRAVRWVKPEQMHLTLRFIGETEKNLLPEIQDLLDQTAAQHSAFTLNLEGFGCFPNSKRPRVLWAGVGGDIKAAGRLKDDIDVALEPLGWEAEKRTFRPHLTIGRVKDSRKVAARRWPDEVQPLTIAVDSIHLIKSELTPAGAIHTMLHNSALQPA